MPGAHPSHPKLKGVRGKRLSSTYIIDPCTSATANCCSSTAASRQMLVEHGDCCQLNPASLTDGLRAATHAAQHPTELSSWAQQGVRHC
mmetsp:Transcript_91324/g.181524  ORF Transcript_91324/g.181524 Transcript_91324/m.181524 type:complete len:89 (-) Transcript_91324:1324-1590(-)